MKTPSGSIIIAASILYVVMYLAAFIGTVKADELLIPLVSRHTSYHGKKIDHLNEQNYGIGYERNGYFAVIFKDSLSNTSGMAGMNFRRQIELGGGWHVSGTIAAGLMVRKNVNDYTPFPVAVPFVGVGRYSWTAELTYIPATRFTEQGAAFLMLRRSL